MKDIRINLNSIIDLLREKSKVATTIIGEKSVMVREVMEEIIEEKAEELKTLLENIQVEKEELRIEKEEEEIDLYLDSESFLEESWIDEKDIKPSKHVDMEDAEEKEEKEKWRREKEKNRSIITKKHIEFVKDHEKINP